MGGHLKLVILALTMAPLLLWANGAAHADEGQIQVVSSGATSEFPEGIRFKLEATGGAEIASIAVRFRQGLRARGAYDYLEYEEGELVDAELFWRTDTLGRYIPPGTILTYSFEVEDSEGTRLTTEPQQLIYYDARFDWLEVADGPVSVAYHGPVQARAKIVLNAITQTLAQMGPILGADTEEPIRVTMYNNVKEMLGALPPGSATVRRELVTEGQAFSDVGTLLVLGSGSMAKGTASHEVTHILTHRAGDSVFRGVPSWLNEGLSELGNIDPGYSYDIALDFAVATDRLLPITSLQIIPGNPEEAIIFYGQARSIVRFMVDKFGPGRMRELMATLQSGKRMDDALEDVYGVRRVGLENQWRRALGAPEYVPPAPGSALPTAIPLPPVLPYSLTPQPLSSTVSGNISTPTPEAQEAVEPTPAAVAMAVTPATEPETPTVSPQVDGVEPGGAACGLPQQGARGIDLAAVTLLVGLAGLGLRSRFRR